MPIKRHLCASIQGLLQNNKRKGSLKGVLKDATGRDLSDEEARAYLQECLAKGWRVIPVGECDNFDYQTGCRGHSL